MVHKKSFLLPPMSRLRKPFSTAVVLAQAASYRGAILVLPFPAETTAPIRHEWGRGGSSSRSTSEQARDTSPQHESMSINPFEFGVGHPVFRDFEPTTTSWKFDEADVSAWTEGEAGEPVSQLQLMEKLCGFSKYVYPSNKGTRGTRGAPEYARGLLGRGECQRAMRTSKARGARLGTRGEDACGRECQRCFYAGRNVNDS